MEDQFEARLTHMLPEMQQRERLQRVRCSEMKRGLPDPIAIGLGWAVTETWRSGIEPGSHRNDDVKYHQ